MHMKKGTSCLLLALWLLSSCSHNNRMAPAAYMNYFQGSDNKLVRTVDNGPVSYRIKLLPPAFFALREAGGKSGMSKSLFEKRLGEIKGNTYFLIEIRNNSNGTANDNPDAKSQAVSYYQNYAAGLIRMVIDDQQTITPSFANYEDSYSLSPVNKILVCFNYDLSQVKQEAVITYNDQLFHNPDIRAAFSKEMIGSIPQLNF
jgi:hypothetical protein